VERDDGFVDTMSTRRYFSCYENWFVRSREKVLCFAKNPGEAIIGSVTGEGEFKGGKRCILETSDKPDVDLSDELVGDFGILKKWDTIILFTLKSSEPSTSIIDCLKESSRLTMHRIGKPQICLRCILRCASVERIPRSHFLVRRQT
jgi:hypothetical protein